MKSIRRFNPLHVEYKPTERFFSFIRDLQDSGRFRNKRGKERNQQGLLEVTISSLPNKSQVGGLFIRRSLPFGNYQMQEQNKRRPEAACDHKE